MLKYLDEFLTLGILDMFDMMNCLIQLKYVNKQNTYFFMFIFI